MTLTSTARRWAGAVEVVPQDRGGARLRWRFVLLVVLLAHFIPDSLRLGAYARKMLGWPERCQLAHALLWEHSCKRLQLAQLLCQLGVFRTLTLTRRCDRTLGQGRLVRRLRVGVVGVFEGSLVLSLCTTAHPLHTRSTSINYYKSNILSNMLVSLQV